MNISFDVPLRDMDGDQAGSIEVRIDTADDLRQADREFTHELVSMLTDRAFGLVEIEVCLEENDGDSW